MDYNMEEGKHISNPLKKWHIMLQEGLKQCVTSRLPELLANNKIGLIVVDSVAAVFRAEYNHNEGRDRARDLRVIGLKLHSLSNANNLSVVCINQVSKHLICKLEPH